MKPLSWISLHRKFVWKFFFRFSFWNQFSFPHSLPYDWKSPIKFSLTFLLQAIASYYWAAVFFVLLCFFIGFRFISLKFLSDIETSFKNLSSEIISKSERVNIEERIKLKTKFYGILKFHAEVKQLSLDWIKCNLIHQKTNV